MAMLRGGCMAVPCRACLGRGIIPTPRRDKWQVCPLCGGRGYIVTSELEGRKPAVWEKWI